MHSCIVVTKSNEDDASYRILTYVSYSHSSVSHPARARVRSGTHFHSCYHDISAQGTASIYEFTRAHSAHSQTLRPAVACAFRWPQCYLDCALHRCSFGSGLMAVIVSDPIVGQQLGASVTGTSLTTLLPRHTAPIPLRCLCVACARRNAVPGAAARIAVWHNA